MPIAASSTGTTATAFLFCLARSSGVSPFSSTWFGSAPAISRASITSGLAFFTAACSRDWPLLSVWLASARWSQSMVTKLRFPFWTAMPRGVTVPAAWLTLALCSISLRAASSCPLATDACKGEKVSLVPKFGSALCVRSSWRISISPFSAAACSGVCPLFGWIQFGFTPSTKAFLTSMVFPSFALVVKSTSFISAIRSALALAQAASMTV
mmetsp:Transcript_45875/g.103917  ORF Transcript_45875/g.103917 Transcript_45875/m.103917 type:complete len:211 (-) Transcript_45875:598-1230(-)